MNKECINCIKRKTMLCPNSSECYETEDKPYYRETDRDFEIELIEENKQLKEKYLEAVDKCMQRDSKIQKAIDYIKTNELKIEQTPFVHIRRTTIDIAHLLEILEKGDSNE